MEKNDTAIDPNDAMIQMMITMPDPKKKKTSNQTFLCRYDLQSMMLIV